jgi:MFS transporter, DHA1 family, inner membrane transport protein
MTSSRPVANGPAGVLVLAIGTFATGTDAFIIAGLLPLVAGSLHTSIAAAGQLVTVFALAYAVGSPLVVTATAGWPRRRVLVGSLLLFALVNVGSAASPAYGVLMGTRVLAAVLAGLFSPTAAASAAAMVAPDRRGRALAVVLGGTSLSTVLGVPIGLYAADLLGWRAAFLFVAALSVLAAAGIATLLPAVANPPRVSLRERAEVFRRPDILSVLLITVVANAGAFSVYTYLAEVFHGGLQALIFTFGVAAVLGGYLSGHGADRWGAERVLAVLLVVFTVDHLLLPLWTGALALVYMAVWGVAGWGTVPPQQHRLVRRAGANAGVAISLNASAIYLGIGLGGLLGGYVVETAGADRLWLAAGGCGAVALLLLPLSARRSTRRAPGDDDIQAAARDDRPAPRPGG